MLFPLVLGGVSIIASIIGTFAVRSATGNVERALYQGLIVAGVIAAAAFYPITQWMMDGMRLRDSAARRRAQRRRPLPLRADRPRDHRRCLFVITDYYTSTRFSPVKKIARGVGDRPRDEHHPGPRAGPAGHGRCRRS